MKKLDEKGRCCGRKPLVYKRRQGLLNPSGLFCCRCDRHFDPETGEQIENFAWILKDGEFVERDPITREART